MEHDPMPMAGVARRGWSERWSPWGGLLFSLGILVLFFVGGADTGGSPEELTAYVEDNEAITVALQLFAIASVGLLGWFVSGLHARVRRLESKTAPGLVLVGGAALVVLFLVAVTMWSAPLLEFDTLPGSADVKATAYYMLEDVGWFSLGGAGLGAALMAVAASVSAMRGGLIGPLAGWVGAVLGGLSILTVAFFGLFAWILWILLASILMLTKRV